MITVSRKEGESIIIQKGELNWVINLSNLTENSVNVSIDAPMDYNIEREELVNNDIMAAIDIVHVTPLLQM